MKTIALAIALSVCPPVKMVNKTKFPWNGRDKVVMARCVKHCPEIWSDAPCLKMFEKHEEHGYHCLCGK